MNRRKRTNMYFLSLQYSGYESFRLQILQKHQSKTRRLSSTRMLTKELRFSPLGNSHRISSNEIRCHHQTNPLLLCCYQWDCLAMLSSMSLSRENTHDLSRRHDIHVVSVLSFAFVILLHRRIQYCFLLLFSKIPP